MLRTSKCPDCGKRKSQYARYCKACDKKIMEKAYAEANAIVATGVCPVCGKKLKRNYSLTGWWQCEQFGSEQFRKYPELPSCNFQIFTE